MLRTLPLRGWLLLLLVVPVAAQTFEVNPSPSNSTSTPATKPSRKPLAKSGNADTAPGTGGIGWGSGIEVARNARAAQQALERSDFREAVQAASRAVKSAPQDPNMWFLLGYSARLAGQYAVAENAYKNGLERQPSSILGLSGLAQTYARMGRGAEAQEILQKVLAANPKSATDLLLAGELSLSSDPTAALDLLKRGEAVEPSSRAELLIARAYQKLNRSDEAGTYIERAMSRAPNDSNVLRAAGAFYRDAGQYDLAISTLQKAGSKSVAALAELAYTYQLAGNKKQAAEAYAQAANRAPRDLALQLSAAQAAVEVNKLDQAQTLLARAASLDANSYRLHAIRGQIANLLDRNDDSIHEYQVAIANLPQDLPEGPLYPISLHLDLYELYQKAENDQQSEAELTIARNAIQKITGVDESSQVEFLRLRALIAADSGDTAAAEKDLKSAITIAPNNLNLQLNYASLLRKMDRKQEAFELYGTVLNEDHENHSALSAMGYLAREIADSATAEKYFVRLASLYPRDYVPYLALGDLYTSDKKFEKAQHNYERAHELAPNNPIAFSGGTNSAIEGHTLPIAKGWLDRAEQNSAINQNPQVMRERERYLTLTGRYEESAQLGYKVIDKLPHDPEAPIYLAYDLVFLNRHAEAYEIVKRFQPLMPKDKDLWLIAGYVHTHDGALRLAESDFTKAIELDPGVYTAYMNRGFVRNDMREAAKAIQDFETAIKLHENYGEAHIGLAYSYLQLRRSRLAVKEADAAQKIMGENGTIYLARAEAYRQQAQFRKAEAEYRAAIKLLPNDLQAHLSLADALFRLHRYADSLEALKGALGLGGDDALVYAQMSRCYAELHDGDNARKSIIEAERIAGNDSKVLLATGETLLTLGDHKGAMERYTRALDASGSERIETRLALARLFARAGKHDEAQQQVSFGLAEARVSSGVTAENLVEAGQVLMSVNQYDLAKRFFERAGAEGADDETVDVGLANAYLALGQTDSAKQVLQTLANDPDSKDNYEYLMTLGNIYRQQQNTVQALSLLAQANREVSDPAAEQNEMNLASEEGAQINPTLSVQSLLSLTAIFEDINIYTLDARLRGITNPALLPPPRSSYQSFGQARYRLHLNNFPVISGFVAERNAVGTFSFPSQLLIQDRNTYDTMFNVGVNPILHLGDTSILFTPGLQFTLRRDSSSPLDINENLFRQFVYMYTSPIKNWLSISADASRETGPFTERDLHSRDLSASVNFVFGRPWGRTSLLTGYQIRDVLFRPLIREYFNTNTYFGVQRKIGDNWKLAVVGEYLRAWRVEDTNYALAQAIRPGFRVDYGTGRKWSGHAAGTWSRGEGFHAYDNFNNEVMVSYTRGIHRNLNDGIGDVPVTYPLRFSFGLQQQTFYNFSGSGTHTVRPVFQLNFF